MMIRNCYSIIHGLLHQRSTYCAWVVIFLCSILLRSSTVFSNSCSSLASLSFWSFVFISSVYTDYVITKCIIKSCTSMHYLFSMWWHYLSLLALWLCWAFPPCLVAPHHEFGKKQIIKCSCQLSWFTRWKWLHYDKESGVVFCHP